MEATLFLYRAAEDSNDITETFRATILSPPPPGASGAPEEFGLSMADILGDAVPNGHDPSDLIMFGLDGLQELVMRSLPKTERLRAASRAEKLMVKAGVWEGQESFANAKRRRFR